MLDARRLGLAAGILWGASMFVMIFLAYSVGYALLFAEVIMNVYPGVTKSVMGSFVALAWGFVDGFVLVWLYAKIYNALGD